MIGLVRGGGVLVLGSDGSGWMYGGLGELYDDTAGHGRRGIGLEFRSVLGNVI